LYKIDLAVGVATLPLIIELIAAS